MGVSLKSCILGIWEMSGEYKDAAMRYEGELYAGGKIPTGMTFFNLGSR